MDVSVLNTFARLALILIPLAKTVLAQDETITIASARFVVNPTLYILNGTTIAPGSAAVSIDGQLVSADSANDLFVNGVEVLTGYPAASHTSDVASAKTTAPRSTVFSTVDNNGSTCSSSSISQSSSVASGLTSDVASFYTISSHWSNVSISAMTTATVSHSSSPAVPLSSSASSISYTDSTTLATSVTVVKTAITNPTNSASPLAPGSTVSSNAARSSSSIRPDSNARISPASSASSKVQSLKMAGSSASSASHSSTLASVTGSALDAALYLWSSSSISSIQSDYSTRSSVIATRGTSLLSNGTTSGLSYLTTQPSTSLSFSTTASLRLGSSERISSVNVDHRSTTLSIPGSITSGPTITMPIATTNPTGSVASAAGFSLGSLVYGIADQTLSNIITNSASSSSYVSKIDAVESKWDSFYKEIGGDDLPSYNTTCTGGGLTGLLKLAGCIASGLIMIKVGIEGIDADNPGPELTEIEGIIADVAEMAQEEESEEDDDDDDDDQKSTQDDSRASKTQHSLSALRTLVSSTVLSSSTISSSISSSIISSELIPCDSIVPQALPAVYSINTAAAEVVLGFVGDILFSVFDEEMSGFTTSTTSSLPISTPSSSPPPPQTDPALTTPLTPSSSSPVYECTMIIRYEDLVWSQTISICVCNDGGHPTPTPTASSLACPSQVTSTIEVLPGPRGPPILGLNLD